MGTIYAVYLVCVLGLLAAIGVPLMNTYSASQQIAGECLRQLNASSHKCLRELEQQMMANLQVAKAVTSMIPGVPNVVGDDEDKR